MVEVTEAERKAEKRGYSKGYIAGRKNAAQSRSRAAKERAKERMWQQVFCAALQGAMVNRGWKTGEKAWITSADYVRGCGQIADEAIKQHGWRA